MEVLFTVFSYLFWVLLAIFILVFVHELGHFLMAKLFGMRVERFSVGFPPKVLGRKVGDTEYVIGATPLGGYVKISGMIDESLDEDLAEEPKPWEYRSKPVWQRMVVITAGVIFNVILAIFIFAGLKFAYGETYIPAENVEEIYVSESSIAYDMGLRSGDRVVAVGGRELERFEDLVDINTLLADSLTITVERGGEQHTFYGPHDIMTQLTRAQRQGRGIGISMQPAVVGGIVEGMPADEAGLRAGDRIVFVNDQPVRFWGELTDHIERAGPEPLHLQWQRPDSLLTEEEQARLQEMAGNDPPVVVERTAEYVRYESSVMPDYNEGEDRYVLGIYDISFSPELVRQEFGIDHLQFGVGGAMVAGARETWSSTKGIAESLRRVFVGRDDFRENVGGPVAIARITKEAAEAGARSFWFVVAMLSITLAILNILPIPALDGGHLMFLLYEAVTRREPSARVRMAMQQIGMIVLLVFMAFVIFNDILRW